MTVSELIEKLKEFPQDYEVKIKCDWFSYGDYDYGMNEFVYNADDIIEWDDSKSVTIRVWG